MVAECPPPPSGTVKVNCAALSGLCQLGSCESAECPDGMECREQRARVLVLLLVLVLVPRLFVEPLLLR
jgi:hypothetical protein